MFTADFWRRAEGLRRPEMGTEVMAPLLYQLVRFTRPRTVLEVGMGYTSLFLAQALADNHRDNRTELQAMRTKTRRMLERSANASSAAEQEQAQLDWLLADRTYGNPLFYQAAVKPVLVAIDTLTHPTTSAPAVQAELDALGLAEFVTVINSDFRGAGTKLDRSCLPIELAWFDVGGAQEYEDFFGEFWPLIAPGGVVVFHYTLSNAGPESFVDALRKRQHAGQLDLEILSLIEPHKLAQNSFTMVRRTSGVQRTHYLQDRALQQRLRNSAQALLSPAL